jgi:6-phosphogluconolactonase
LSLDCRHLYAVGEVAESGGKRGGTVSAFAIDRATGALTLLNQRPSGGAGPCHVSLDSSGRHAFVANYTSGSIASYPINTDGTLGQAASLIQHHGKGTDPSRKEGPHAHGIWPSPDNRFVLTCDLGLDKVLVYKFDPASGQLTPNNRPAGNVPPGAGARHAAFSPDGKFLYVINEMGNTMTVFAWDAKTGALTELQTLGTLPQGHKETSYTSEVAVHPSGRFVYGSNRGHDSIAIFTVDPAIGKLALTDVTPMGGKWPRHFNIDPTGQWLVAAGERSDTLAVFRIDENSGALVQTGEPVEAPSPACVVFANVEQQ